MNTNFEGYWKTKQKELEAYGITEAQARKVYNDSCNYFVNRFMLKAQEFFNKTSAHPSEAIIDSLKFAGVPEEDMLRRLSYGHNMSVFEAMEDTAFKQFAEQFPHLAHMRKPKK